MSTHDGVRLPDGRLLTIRSAGPNDVDALKNYFRALSPRSRTNRLMGPAPELPPALLDRFVQRVRPAPLHCWPRFQATPANAWSVSSATRSSPCPSR
jgi:hypothetical protein